MMPKMLAVIVIAMIIALAAVCTMSDAERSEVTTQPEGLSNMTLIVQPKSGWPVYSVDVEGGKIYFRRDTGMVFVPDVK